MLLDNINLRAAEMGLTLADVEVMADLKGKTIYRWNTSTPSVDKVDKVARVLEISVDDLIHGTWNEKKKRGRKKKK